MTIGENIQRIRKEKGMTQKQLGKRLNMTQSAIGQFENDKTSPKIETVKKIATALEVDMVDIMGMEYFDSITDLDTLRREISQIEVIENYFRVLGFSLKNNITKCHWEDDNKEVQIIDEIEYILSTDGCSATFTQKELDELRTGTKELIEGKFYKKLMQKQEQ